MKVLERDLKLEWDELKKQNPKLRIRNAAEALGVTELELLITTEAKLLKSEFKNILKDVGELGEVMALTRNDNAVHEVKGVYDKPEFNPGPVGMFLGEWIDLRIFFASWKFAFYVSEDDRKSIQFFDKHGSAVHKIYLTDKADENKFLTLVERYSSSTDADFTLESPSAPHVYSNVREVDIASFQEGWLEMKDTHEFFGLLKKFNLSRVDALRNAPSGNYAIELKHEATHEMLNSVSEKKCPIMCFVGNPGMIQIFSGEVSRIVDMEEWLNVLDPRFNLHVKKKSIVSTWLVRKPSVDGIVTSIECFDDKGEIVVQFFGKRKPGIPELIEWRSIMDYVELDYKM